MTTLLAVGVLLGLAAMAVGFLSFLIYPFKFLGVRSRSQGFGLLVLSTIGTGVASYQFASTNGTTPQNSIKSGVAQMAEITEASKAPIPSAALPQSEQRFIEVVQNAKANFENGANDMAKGAARPTRARALCALNSSGDVVDWVGSVAKLSSNSDGKGVLEITVAEGITVETWNNEVSDFADHTLIDPSSALFAQASKLVVGQTVRFSGRFSRSSSDCLKESSMTLAGSMTEPDFVFRFTSVDAQ